MLITKNLFFSFQFQFLVPVYPTNRSYPKRGFLKILNFEQVRHFCSKQTVQKQFHTYKDQKQQILTRNFIVVDDWQTSAKLTSKRKFPTFYTDAESLQAVECRYTYKTEKILGLVLCTRLFFDYQYLGRCVKTTGSLERAGGAGNSCE